MFLAPGLLAGALAVAVPVLLHFLRRQPTAVHHFPTLTLLVKSLKRKARLNDIRRWLVLLARCAILGLLALAFARPFFAQPFRASSTGVMIVLDDSYSMGAGGQFQKAKTAAIAAVHHLSGADLAGLILADSHPRLAVPLRSDKEAVVRAIEAAPLSDEANNYDATLRLADAQLAAAPCGRKRIDLFGDNQNLAWQGVDFDHPLTPGVELNVAPTEARQIDDAAIDEVKITAPFTVAQQKMSALLTLRNRSLVTTLQRTVHLELDGREVATLGVSLQPGEVSTRTLEFTAGALQPTRGLARIEADKFPINDTRYFALNPQAPLYAGIWPPVAEGEVDSLSVALAPSPALATVTPVAITSAADIDQSKVLVIRPVDAPDSPLVPLLANAIRQGKPALIFADDSHACALWLGDLGLPPAPRPESDDPLHLGAVDFTFPEVALFAKPGNGDLFGIRFTDPPHLTLPSGAKVVASFEDNTPAIAEISVGAGSVVLVATGLDRASTTWPFQSTFLPFLQECLKRLVAREEWPSQVLVGEPLPGDHPGVDSAKAGLVPVTLQGEARLIAVNIDPAEGNLAPWTNLLEIDRLSSAKLKSPSVVGLAMLHGEDAERRQHFWWYLILAAAVVLLAEIFLANRTTL